MGLEKTFIHTLVSAMDSKKEYESLMKSACEYLEKIAPYNNEWYYNDTGFLMVDIVKEEYDDYFEFVENIVGCSYCHLMRENGITLMLNIATIVDKNQPVKK